MGIKIIIKEACLVAGENIGQPVAIGERVEVSKEDALYLARAGRSLYLEKGDDPSKGLMTATSADIAAIKLHAAAVEAEASARSAQPQSMAEIIASAVKEAAKEAFAAGVAVARQAPAAS